MAKITRHLLPVLALMILTAGAAAAQETPPTQEQLWRLIQEQQRQIEALHARLGKTENAVSENSAAVEATAEAVEDEMQGGPGWRNNTSLGGYGELHYNGGDTDEIDLHRFVLFFGHEFSDKMRFQSELEVEHTVAGESQNGEVEIEQAYIEFDYRPSHHAVAGLWLVPAGIINETHEPPTFYGVERNNVEKNIIPTTWWECGFGFRGGFENGIGYDAGFHSGLRTPITGNSAFKVRNGRQKCSEAAAKDFAYTGRLTYSAIPGLKLAMTAQYQNDLTQGQDPTSAFLITPHVDYSRDGFGLRALYAHWDLDNQSNTADTLGRDRQDGWYLEPSYRFELTPDWGDLGVFTRYLQFNNEAGGSGDDTAQVALGLNYWPDDNVVIKLDFLADNPPAGTNADDRFNAAVGYQF